MKLEAVLLDRKRRLAAGGRPSRVGSSVMKGKFKSSPLDTAGVATKLDQGGYSEGGQKEDGDERIPGDDDKEGPDK